MTRTRGSAIATRARRRTPICRASSGRASAGSTSTFASQVLTAYVGERAVFATLVSTGRGADGSELATPRGTHRLWVKLKTSNMDNLDDESATENYAIQAVPWVMYFEHGYGLHGTFWHRDFGNKHSHGCVNLTPLDAERLFPGPARGCRPDGQPPYRLPTSRER